MKVLLRQPDTGLFYAGPNSWTMDVGAAHDFQETNRAIDEVSQSNLSAVEVLMQFENPTFEIPLKIVSTGH
jgi:hypothetical protein